MSDLRPVQVDFSVREARAAAAALDLAAHILDCDVEQPADGLKGDELRILQTRLLQGSAIAELEEQLGYNR